MFLTKEEIKAAVIALVLNEEGKSNIYPLAELKDATEIFNKMNESTNDDVEKSYTDGELELTTSQKSLLIKCLSRKWSPADGVYVLSLLEKLEK